MQGVLVLMSAFHQSVYNGLTAAAQREAWKIQAAHAQQTAASSASSVASSAAGEEEEAEKSEEASEQSKQTESLDRNKSDSSIPIDSSNGNKPDPSNPIDSSNGNKPDSFNPIDSSNGNKPDPSNPIDSSPSSLDSEELREVDSPSFHGYYLCNAAYAPLIFRSLARVLHGEHLRLVTAQCCVYILRFLLTNHVYGDLLPCSLVQDLASLFPLFHRSSL